MNTIKEWLKANKRTVAYLARESGISRQAMDSILSGKSIPTIPTLTAISRVTGISVGDMSEELATTEEGK